ncbi:hypothetical protein ACXR2U_07000 [Jatrophihabitans sp. YIM 134969]
MTAARTTDFTPQENTMYGLQEALSRERCADRRREAARYRLGRQEASARRWRRRAESARQRAESYEAGVAESARRDYELAGR